MSYVDKKIDLLVETVESCSSDEEPHPLRNWALEELSGDTVRLGIAVLETVGDPRFRERAGKILRILPPLRTLIPEWKGIGAQYRDKLFELESKLLDAVERFDKNR